MTFDYDVAIIGSGVSGALCAWQLVESKKVAPGRIVILEAGHNGLDSRQRDEFHRGFLDDRSRRGWSGPYAGLASKGFAPWPEQPDKPALEKYYDQNPVGPKNEVFRGYYIRVAGGSTWAWRGNTPRLVAGDFVLKDKYGVGDNWPIRYEQLEPDYHRAEQALGVSGDHDEWNGLHGSPRSEPFPMPHIALSHGDKLMKAALDGQNVDGVPILVRSTPQARNSERYDARPACEGNSNCIPLCPIGAKYDATVHLNKVIKAGVELRTGCVVTALEPGDGADTVNVIRYRDWRSSDRTVDRKLTAKVIVLAAHAVETPKILLLSSKLAYANDAETPVGRYLMDHVQQEATGLFPKHLYPFRGPQSLCGIEDFRDGSFRKDHAPFRMTVGNDGWGRREAPPQTLDGLIDPPGAKPLFGKELRRAIEDRITRMVRISYSCEVLPSRDNRVQLSPLVDPLGIPRPRLTFQVGDYTWKGLERGRAVATGLLARIGCTDIAPDKLEESYNTAAHIMGTCRMGDDKKTSVVNAHGRSHLYKNLYVVGSSVFTTAGTANPTLTIAALTIRTARAIEV